MICLITFFERSFIMFIWKEEFELNIPTIDAQHKKLLSIGNQINDLLSTHEDNDDDFDEILNILLELKNYTIYHFKTEEDLFLKYNYPEYIQHKKEHDGFIAYLNEINLDQIDSNQTVFLKDLLAKIVNWVFRHIITTDFMYKDFLLQLGMK